VLFLSLIWMTILEIRIRDANADDAANLVALSIQVWLHTYATDGIRSVISELVLGQFTPEHFTRMLALPKYRLRVAIYRAHLIGYSLLDLDSRCELDPAVSTELVTLYVQEPFIGQNVGSMLLNDSQSQLGGEKSMWLSVYVRNERAVKFYRKHGFIQAGQMPFEFGGESHMNDVLVRHPLLSTG
jgi:diamine N-acetyltransferase